MIHPPVMLLYADTLGFHDTRNHGSQHSIGHNNGNIHPRGQYKHASALPTWYMDTIQWFGTLVDDDTPTSHASVCRYTSFTRPEIMRLTPLLAIIMVTSIPVGNISMPVHFLHGIWTQYNGLEH
jgi:hypothetical protein